MPLTYMNVSKGLWSFLGLASSWVLGDGAALRVDGFTGHMGSWLPHTKLGLEPKNNDNQACTC